MHFPADLHYLALIFGLFVVPKFLQRFRVPSALTSLGLGVLAGAAGLFTDDATVALLASLGISSLFLFAGLEVDLAELRRGSRILATHLALRAGMLVIAAWGITAATGLDVRVSGIVALALLTPSTGFILDSLPSFGLSPEGRFWTKSKAIGSELLALAALFVLLQSTSAARLLTASAVLVLLILAIPVVFRVFAERFAPFAPRSEFAFLLMLAVVCAYATRALGVYYLVGAFLVGVAAHRFREQLPAMSSERMLHAVEAFASVFTPFYFFGAGLHIQTRELVPEAFGAALLFLVVCVPAGLLLVTLHRSLALGEPARESVRIGQALLPTLVFSLVLAGILRERFEAPPWLVGGIVLYAVVNTLVPGFLLRQRAPLWDAPHLPRASPSSPEGEPDPGAEPSITGSPSPSSAPRSSR